MADAESNIIINVDTSVGIAEIKNLQRQISELNAQLLKSGAQQAKSAQNIQRNLINNINATGQFAASVKTISSTAESFTTALERNKLSMGEYFRYAGASTKTFGRLFKNEFNTIQKVAESRVKTLQTQYIKLGRDANGALKAIAVRPLALDMESLATKTAMAAQRQQLFNQLLKQGSTNLLNFGKNTQWAGRQLMVGFSIPLGYMGALAAKTFMQMEEQAIRFKRVYGDSFTATAETDKMIEQVKQLASEFTKYGVAAEKTMQMAADAAAMGLMNADLLAQINQATRLSVLGGVEQEQALETTISLMNAFGTSAKDLTKDINFLNAVENQTVTAIEDLTIAIPKAAPVIKQLGGDVKDLAFFLTAMKEGGINASEGANALKSGLASLINPTGKATEFLQGFGINLKGIVDANKGDVKGTVVAFAQALDTLDPLNRARAIEQLFGKFQFARLSTLFQNVIKEGTQAQRVLQITRQSSTELAILSERELKRVEDSPMYKFKKAVEDIKVSLVPLGEAFLKAITPVVEFAKGFLDRFNSMSEGAKNFAVVATTIVAGIGPILLMTFGLVANGVANLIKMFAAIGNIMRGTGGSSRDLATSTEYLTQQQLEAAAVASSLDQSHSKLIQTFSAETGAVNNLATAYARAVVAQSRLIGVPGASAAGKGGTKKPPLKLNSGIISVPGPKGAGDIVPAMLSPGEAVIPAKQSEKYAGLINGMINDNIPGYRIGRNPFAALGKMQVMRGKSSQGITDWNNLVPDNSGWSILEGLARTLTGRRGTYGPSSSAYANKMSDKFLRGRGKKVAVRMFSDDLVGALGRGDKRYQSIFERGGTSRGSGDAAGGQRALAEERLFGLTPGADASKRPAYGYLFKKEMELSRANAKPLYQRLGGKPDTNDRLANAKFEVEQASRLMNENTYRYGDVAMILKNKALRGRTTITQGDSLNSYLNQYATPAKLGTRSRQALEAAKPTQGRREFFEAQILGGFSFKDIKRMVATEPQTILALQTALKQAGIRGIKVGMPRLTMMQRLQKFVYGRRAMQQRMPRLQGDGPYAGKYREDPRVINGRAFYSGGATGDDTTEFAKKLKKAQKDLRGAPEAIRASSPNISYASLEAENELIRRLGREYGLNQSQSDNLNKLLGTDRSHIEKSVRTEFFGGKSREVKNWATDNLKVDHKLVNQTLDNISRLGSPKGSFLASITPEQISKATGMPISAAKKELARIKSGGHPMSPNGYRALQGVARLTASTYPKMATGVNSRILDRLIDFRLNDKSAGSYLAADAKGMTRLSADKAADAKALQQQNARIKRFDPSFVPGSSSASVTSKAKAKTAPRATKKVAMPKGSQAIKLSSILRGGPMALMGLAAAGGLVSSMFNERKYNKGVVSVPGPKGKGDVTPAMLTPGEAVIPAEMAKKYSPLISGMISDSIPGYEKGFGEDLGLSDWYTGKKSDSPGSTAASDSILARSQANTAPVDPFTQMPNQSKPVQAEITNTKELATDSAKTSAKFADKVKSRVGGIGAELREARVAMSQAKGLDKLSMLDTTRLGDRISNSGASRVASRLFNTRVGGSKKTFDAGAEVRVDKNGKEYGYIKGKGRVSLDEARAAMPPTRAQRTPGGGLAGMRGRMSGPAQGIGMVASTVGMGMMMSGDPKMQEAGGMVMAGGMLASLLPMLMNPVGLIVAGLAATAGIIFLINKTLEDATKAGQEQAKAMTMTSEKLESMSQITGGVTANQISDRVRQDQLTGESAKKRIFGQEYMESEAGKAMLEDAGKMTESGMSNKEIAENFASQLSYAVLQGAVTQEQANSIAFGLGEKLQDYSITSNIVGNLTSLYGRNGENLLTDPLSISLEIQKDQTKQQVAAYDNAISTIEENTKQSSEAMTNYIAGGLMFLGGAALTATGIGAGLGVALMAGGVAAVGSAAVMEGVTDESDNNEARGVAIQLGAEQIAQNQGLVDSLSRQYDSQINQLEAQKESAKTEAERIGIESQINAKIAERDKALKSQKTANAEVFSGLMKQAESMGDSFTSSIDLAIDEKYKEASGGVKAAVSLAKKDLESLPTMQNGKFNQFKATLQLGLASGEFDPITVSNLINANEESNGVVETKFKAIVSAQGTAEANQLLQLLGKGGVKTKDYDVILSYMNTSDTFTEDMEAIAQIANMNQEYGITIIPNVKNIELVGDFIKETENMPEVITQEIITDYIAKYPNMSKETKSALAQMLANWNVLSGGDNKLNYQVIVDYMIGTVDPAAAIAAYRASNPQFVNTPDSIIQGPALAEFFSDGASTDIVPGEGEDKPTPSGAKVKSPYEDILNKLKQVRDFSINAAGGLKELMRVLGGNRQLTMFEGMEQLSLSSKVGRGFSDYLMGLDQKTRDLFVKFKKGKAVLTEAGEAMRKAFQEDEIGSFQINLALGLEAFRNQESALNILVDRGMEYSDAMEIASDETVALAIASGQLKGKELERLIGLTKDYNDELRISNALASVREDISAFEDQVKINKYVTEGRKLLSDWQKELKAGKRADGTILDAEDKKLLQEDIAATSINIEAFLGDSALQELYLAGGEMAEEFNKRLDQIVGSKEFVYGMVDKATSAVDQWFSNREQQIILDFELGTNLSGKNAELVNVKALQNEIDAAQAYIAERAFNIDDYEYQLDQIVDKEDEVNKKYDERLEALNDVFDINKEISESQRSQLDLAAALSSGDIAAAARARQQLEASRAEQFAEQSRKNLEAQREKELKAIKINGMTREQIEKKIKDLQDEIAKKEEESLEPKQRDLDIAQRSLDTAIESLSYLNMSRDAWEQIGNKIAISREELEKYASILAALQAGDLLGGMKITDGTEEEEKKDEFVRTREFDENRLREEQEKLAKAKDPELRASIQKKIDTYIARLLADDYEVKTPAAERKPIQFTGSKAEGNDAFKEANPAGFAAARLAEEQEKLAKAKDPELRASIQAKIDTYTKTLTDISAAAMKSAEELFKNSQEALKKADPAAFAAVRLAEEQAKLLTAKDKELRDSIQKKIDAYTNTLSTLAASAAASASGFIVSPGATPGAAGTVSIPAGGGSSGIPAGVFSGPAEGNTAFRDANPSAFAAARIAEEQAKLAAGNLGPGARAAAQAKIEEYAKRLAVGGMVKANYLRMGGMLPYKADGGLFQSINTDTVPAMLTPGEFVVRRFAVQKYGVDRLKSINNGTYNGESVYNYEVNINVKSDANPDQIARAVMTQIKQVDNMRIKGNRFNV